MNEYYLNEQYRKFIFGAFRFIDGKINTRRCNEEEHSAVKKQLGINLVEEHTGHDFSIIEIMSLTGVEVIIFYCERCGLPLVIEKQYVEIGSPQMYGRDNGITYRVKTETTDGQKLSHATRGAALKDIKEFGKLMLRCDDRVVLDILD